MADQNHHVQVWRPRSNHPITDPAGETLIPTGSGQEDTNPNKRKCSDSIREFSPLQGVPPPREITPSQNQVILPEGWTTIFTFLDNPQDNMLTWGQQPTGHEDNNPQDIRTTTHRTTYKTTHRTTHRTTYRTTSLSPITKGEHSTQGRDRDGIPLIPRESHPPQGGRLNELFTSSPRESTPQKGGDRKRSFTTPTHAVTGCVNTESAPLRTFHEGSWMSSHAVTEIISLIPLKGSTSPYIHTFHPPPRKGVPVTRTDRPSHPPKENSLDSRG